MTMPIKIILSFLYIIWIIIIYKIYGVVADGEALKYINAANAIIINRDFSGLFSHWMYSTYIIFLTLLFSIGFSVNGIVVLQLILNLLCSNLFYRTLIYFALSKRAALFAAIMFIFCLPIQKWAFALYTESLFVCLIIIYCFCFTFNGKKQILLTGISGLLLTFCRPVGIFIAISGLLLFSRKLTPYLKRRIIAIIMFVLISVFLMGFFIPVDCNQVAIPIYQGSVISGSPVWDENVFTLPCNLFNVYKSMIKEHGIVDVACLLVK